MTEIIALAVVVLAFSGIFVPLIFIPRLHGLSIRAAHRLKLIGTVYLVGALMGALSRRLNLWFCLAVIALNLLMLFAAKQKKARPAELSQHAPDDRNNN